MTICWSFIHFESMQHFGSKIFKSGNENKNYQLWNTQNMAWNEAIFLTIFAIILKFHWADWFTDQ